MLQIYGIFSAQNPQQNTPECCNAIRVSVTEAQANWALRTEEKPDSVPISSTVFYCLPILLLVIWGFISGLSYYRSLTNGQFANRKLSQVRCRNCQFFSNNPYLKCTVHPTIAMTPEAIECSDFRPANDDCDDVHQQK